MQKKSAREVQRKVASVDSVPKLWITKWKARKLTAAGGHIFSHKLHQYLAKNQLKIMTNLEFLQHTSSLNWEISLL